MQRKIPDDFLTRRNRISFECVSAFNSLAVWLDGEAQIVNQYEFFIFIKWIKLFRAYLFHRWNNLAPPFRAEIPRARIPSLNNFSGAVYAKFDNKRASKKIEKYRLGLEVKKFRVVKIILVEF